MYRGLSTTRCLLRPVRRSTKSSKWFLNDPYGVGDYDKLADHWSTDFADGAAMLVYIVGKTTIRVVVLRVYFV
ncbi:hypothetical protein AN480_29840 (plasmid) [Mycobacterium intracellulare subsp. chimaera]|nr:hypothetical protein AN480_29840 [Mycobacterium intracellulare subsp. chimaera]